MRYFVIQNSDGTTHVESFNRLEFEEKLNNQWWGEDPFLDALPGEDDTNYWGRGILVIKGEIKPPIPRQVVIRWDAEE